MYSIRRQFKMGGVVPWVRNLLVRLGSSGLHHLKKILKHKKKEKNLPTTTHNNQDRTKVATASTTKTLNFHLPNKHTSFTFQTTQCVKHISINNNTQNPRKKKASQRPFHHRHNSHINNTIPPPSPAPCPCKPLRHHSPSIGQQALQMPHPARHRNRRHDDSLNVAEQPRQRQQ